MTDEDRPNRRTRTPGPTREGDSLADVVELLLDKGIVINADIAVSVGETELLGVHIRAALASFETAAEYGLQFPDGTDARRVEQASGREPLEEGEEVVDSADRSSADSSSTGTGDGAPISVRSPSRQGVGDRPDEETSDGEGDEAGGADRDGTDVDGPPDDGPPADEDEAVDGDEDADDGDTADRDDGGDGAADETESTGGEDSSSSTGGSDE